MSRPRGKFGKIPKRELARLTAQLAIMVRSGVDLTTCLASLTKQSTNDKTTAVLNAIYNDVLGGQSFSQALSRYQSAFGATYIASVAAGEASGQMVGVLTEMSQMLRNEVKLRSTIRSMMTYPVVLATVSIAVIFALIVVVLPQFASIFGGFDTSLPSITKYLLAVGTEFRTRYWLWGPVSFAVLASPWVAKQFDIGRLVVDHFWLTGPVCRNFTQPLLTARMCRLLGMTLSSGVPVLESLRLVKSSFTNIHYQRMFDRLERKVLGGGSMGETLLETPFIPVSASEMLSSAERNGNLGEVAGLLGEFFEEEGESRLRDAIGLLEPAITVGMGLVVSLVVLAVLLPMLDIALLAK